MKWLFFLLLLINLGLFVWIYPQDNRAGTQVFLSPGVESIKLFAELEHESSLTVEDQPQIGEKLDGRQADDTAQSKLIAEADSEVEVPNTAESGEAAEAVTDLPTGREQRVVSTASTTAEEVPSDPAFALESDSEPELENAIEAEPELPPLAQCSTLGPLIKRADADRLSLRLRSMGIQPELNTELSNDQEGYWVLVPPRKNRADAVRIVKRLREAGVTDLWRFTSGKLAHAISLGLFRNQSRAELRRESIANKGFEVEVRPRYRQKTTYWLSFTFYGESPFSEDVWQQLIKRTPGIDKRIVDCQEIASQ